MGTSSELHPHFVVMIFLDHQTLPYLVNKKYSLEEKVDGYYSCKNFKVTYNPK
jgi:hypothetical protein